MTEKNPSQGRVSVCGSGAGGRAPGASGGQDAPADEVCPPAHGAARGDALLLRGLALRVAHLHVGGVAVTLGVRLQFALRPVLGGPSAQAQVGVVRVRVAGAPGRRGLWRRPLPLLWNPEAPPVLPWAGGRGRHFDCGLAVAPPHQGAIAPGQPLSPRARRRLPPGRGGGGPRGVQMPLGHVRGPERLVTLFERPVLPVPLPGVTMEAVVPPAPGIRHHRAVSLLRGQEAGVGQGLVQAPQALGEPGRLPVQGLGPAPRAALQQGSRMRLLQGATQGGAHLLPEEGRVPLQVLDPGGVGAHRGAVEQKHAFQGGGGAGRRHTCGGQAEKGGLPWERNARRQHRGPGCKAAGPTAGAPAWESAPECTPLAAKVTAVFMKRPLSKEYIGLQHRADLIFPGERAPGKVVGAGKARARLRLLGLLPDGCAPSQRCDEEECVEL